MIPWRQVMRIIGGSARGRKLIPPTDRSTRPALDRLRESVFSVLGDRVGDARVLDLFAGVGAFGLEALSRGARHATFVEQSPGALAILRRNLTNLGFVRRATVIRGDALSLPDLEQGGDLFFDLVFVDPPFAAFEDPGRARRILERVKEILGSGAVREGTVVVLRRPSGVTDLPFPAEDDRRYGVSRVAFMKRSPGATTPPDP